jgi:heme exporter protein D
MTRNTVVVAPPILGHRKMVAGEVQRRRREAHVAAALQREREETGRTASTVSSPGS